MRSKKTLIRKSLARVFVSKDRGGGNPVTIFRSPSAPLPPTAQERLAQSCNWESVIVRSENNDMQFFMPSGEEVSFCAHAAMGALHNLADGNNFQQTISYATFMGSSPEKDKQVGHVSGNTVRLSMRGDWEIPGEFSFDNASLQAALQQIQLDPTDVELPIVNASIARPKTLLRCKSLDVLRSLRPPPDPTVFRESCDAFHSTGLYPYAKLDDNDDHITSFETRQFPRASGYPEDPATGIAAAALACTLAADPSTTDHSKVSFRFQQGVTMGRTSIIRVEHIRFQGDDVSFDICGEVAVDSKEEVEVDIS